MDLADSGGEHWWTALVDMALVDNNGGRHWWMTLVHISSGHHCWTTTVDGTGR